MHPIGQRRCRGYIVLLFLSSLLVCLPEVLGQRLPVRIYTTADGLWSSAISYLTCDSHGFIWLCTRDGRKHCDAYRYFNAFLRLLRFGAAFITLALVPGAAKGQKYQLRHYGVADGLAH